MTFDCISVENMTTSLYGRTTDSFALIETSLGVSHGGNEKLKQKGVTGTLGQHIQNTDIYNPEIISFPKIFNQKDF